MGELVNLRLPRTIAEAEVAPGTFLFPGRYEYQMREMKVAEENILANRRNWKNAAAINNVLQACMVTESVDVMELLIGDRTFALIQLRRLTYGDEYAFKVNCPACQTRFEWEENLGDLEVRYLEDPGQAAPDHVFSFTFPKTGRTIKWRLLRGKDEQKLAAARRDNPDGLVTFSMLLRTVEIEGEKAVNRRFFDELPGSDAAAFRAEVQAKECGVETTVVVDCPECGGSFDLDLPIGPDFFLPRKKARGQ